MSPAKATQAPPIAAPDIPQSHSHGNTLCRHDRRAAVTPIVLGAHTMKRLLVLIAFAAALSKYGFAQSTASIDLAKKQVVARLELMGVESDRRSLLRFT